MPEMVTRLGILLCTVAAVWLLIWLSQRFVEAQRQQALATAPLNTLAISNDATPDMSAVHPPVVRILAFKSADCRQCYQLQDPALQRVLEVCGDAVVIIDVDAASEHALTQAYHVLTVPSTVLLDATGRARAVNYGFANTQRLLKQIDEILVSD